MSNVRSDRASHVLRFVRALAMVTAAPGCAPREEPPPPYGDTSSGGVVVQGDGVVQSSNDGANAPLVQQVQGGEQRVEMRTVVVGQQQPPPPPVQRNCEVGQRHPAPELDCVCIATPDQRNGWRCAPQHERHHNVGPLPPPELAA